MFILSQDATSKDNPAYGTSGITFVSMIIIYYLLLSIRFWPEIWNLVSYLRIWNNLTTYE